MDIHEANDSPSIKNLTNIVRKGRLGLKRGDQTAGWGTLYFAVTSEKKMYCFDDEDSEEAREMIDLSKFSVYSIHDSFFNRPNCFQLVFEDNVFKARKMSLKKNGGEAVTKQTYNFLSNSLSEKKEWMSDLRNLCDHSYIIIPPSRQDSFDDHFIDSKVTASYTKNAAVGRSLKVWIMEARELGVKLQKTYAAILFNDLKQAKTNIVAGDSPFWGEEFVLDDIPEEFTHLRIFFFTSKNNHKFNELGYISISLESLVKGQKTENWFAINMFGVILQIYCMLLKNA